MNLATLPVFIVLVVQIIHLRTDCQKHCSCYTFENGTKNLFAWTQAESSCKFYNKHLVVMETEREWGFINKEIQTRKTASDAKNEWHIGLYRNLTTGKWTWVNGKPLTIKKWQKYKPNAMDFYTLIAKDWPKGHKGSFNSINGELKRAWICEEETDNCQGVCFIHNPVPTNSTPVEISTATTHQIETVKTSTEYDHTNGAVSDSIPTTAGQSLGGQKGDEDNSSTIVIIAASLAAVLFVMLIVLAVVLLLRRKKRRGHRKDTEIPKKKSSDKKAQLGENHYETVDPVEAAKLLGTQDSSESRPAAKKKVEHETPSPNCEYAMVNKKDKKKKEGDLVYAQLAEFDGDDKATQKPPQKPPSYEPTVYADVDIVPPEVFSRTDPDSTQPTYANVQTTGM